MRCAVLCDTDACLHTANKVDLLILLMGVSRLMHVTILEACMKSLVYKVYSTTGECT